MNRGKDEVGRYAKLAQDLDYAAVGITMDTVKPVKIGDEVPLSTKDGKPRRGHKSSPKEIEVDSGRLTVFPVEYVLRNFA